MTLAELKALAVDWRWPTKPVDTDVLIALCDVAEAAQAYRDIPRHVPAPDAYGQPIVLDFIPQQKAAERLYDALAALGVALGKDKDE